MKTTQQSSLLNGIGKRLRERRKELNITQAEASELLGLSLSFYGQLERGKRRLSLEKILLCRDKLGIDPTYLLTGIRPVEMIISSFLNDCPKEKRYDFEQLIKYAANLYK